MSRCRYCFGWNDRSLPGWTERSCGRKCEQDNQRWDDEIERGRYDAVHGQVRSTPKPASERAAA